MQGAILATLFVIEVDLHRDATVVWPVGVRCLGAIAT